MTLTEFLLARIAEDEAFAEMFAAAPRMTAGEERRVQEGNAVMIFPTFALSPARVLAECEAKRRIVEWASDGEGEFHWSTVIAPLAAVYADHPDYRQEWKP